ncbi:hypothetical protein EDB84DRAFT_1676728, partial [Lactarius hengduanensis]
MYHRRLLPNCGVDAFWDGVEPDSRPDCLNVVDPFLSIQGLRIARNCANMFTKISLGTIEGVVAVRICLSDARTHNLTFGINAQKGSELGTGSSEAQHLADRHRVTRRTRFAKNANASTRMRHVLFFSPVGDVDCGSGNGNGTVTKSLR